MKRFDYPVTIIRRGKIPMSEAQKVVFIPDLCKDKELEGHTVEAAFAGSLTIRLPDFDERMSYAEVTAETRADPSEAGWIKTLRIMVKKSAAHYEAVDLVHKASGRVYRNFNDMTMDPKCDAILAEVATKLIDGFDLGNG